ncbi:Bacterial regulatory proteins, tetR family [Marinomonas aquimarina]|uniref:Bacterial regulatory proteins, tetR family n=1 Tax=Marinomonas aquimarina TaxID=295068 RepID=A0A1A8TF93_9GAMM|nr:TetR/AcrR family transcriptional regulator [Marinomonas aquimarina]SBS31704.1 Bacterial regulatory proteins, tetR family [Marinomonas aquimarina]
MALPPKRVLTQDRLRTAVQNLLLETDWTEITVQDVSSNAGVSIGTFYNYYDSKDEALADVRACLSALIKKDLNSLLVTQSQVECRISLLLKYFVNILNAKPSWANYFYRAESFSERLDGGLVALLEPLVLEGMLSNKGHSQNAKITAFFIENGFFPLLKQYHVNGTSVPEEDATQMVVLALLAMGLSGDRLAQASALVCPVTPIAALPQSIFELEKAQAGHA